MTTIIDTITYITKQLDWKGQVDLTREQKYVAIPREMAKALVEYYNKCEKERKENGHEESSRQV